MDMGPIIELTRLVERVGPEQRLTVESDVHGVSRCPPSSWVWSISCRPHPVRLKTKILKGATVTNGDGFRRDVDDDNRMLMVAGSDDVLVKIGGERCDDDLILRVEQGTKNSARHRTGIDFPLTLHGLIHGIHCRAQRLVTAPVQIDVVADARGAVDGGDDVDVATISHGGLPFHARGL